MDDVRAWQQRLRDDFGLTAVLAAELEWYAWPHTEMAPRTGAVALESIEEAVRNVAPLSLETVEAERGPCQWELSLRPTEDAVQLAADLTQLRMDLAKVLLAQGIQTSFAAKPFADQYGSALHVHLHLADAAGVNVFSKQGDALSDPLAHALAGLLAKVEAHLPIFAPYPDSWARFVPGWHAPVNASWGGNNRTVALRLPDGTGALNGAQALARQAVPTPLRRIEHRISGADADPAAVLVAILEGVHHGLMHRLLPPSAIHGDAAHPQYALRRFLCASNVS
jgi:glutamine synthetase